jgi:hypothetical protein
MNSDDIMANYGNMSHHHVLDVVHAEESLLVQGIYEMITKDDGILR